MTDAKELAARLLREAECDAHNAARDAAAGLHTWANECAASAAIKREAATALDAQEDRIERAHAAMDRTMELEAKIAALEQAAAPFVAVAEIFADGEAWNDFDALFLEPSIDEEVILDDTLSVGDFRALARAAGGRDV